MGLRPDLQQQLARTVENKHHSSPGDLVTRQREEGQHYFANRSSYRRQNQFTGPNLDQLRSA